MLICEQTSSLNNKFDKDQRPLKGKSSPDESNNQMWSKNIWNLKYPLIYDEFKWH